jgi:hypothetical protein
VAWGNPVGKDAAKKTRQFVVGAQVTAIVDVCSPQTGIVLVGHGTSGHVVGATSNTRTPDAGARNQQVAVRWDPVGDTPAWTLDT